MRLYLSAALLLLSACAAHAQDVYRMGWKDNGRTWFGKPFTAESRAKAEERTTAANAVDPTHVRFLVSDTRKLPPYGVALEEMPSARLRRTYWASLLFVAGANGMDIASSYGKRELNPLLQGAGGRFDMSSAMRKTAFVSALEIPQLFVVRRSPRRMKTIAVANFAVGAALMGISLHNFRVPAPAAPASVAAPAAAGIRFP